MSTQAANLRQLEHALYGRQLSCLAEVRRRQLDMYGQPVPLRASPTVVQRRRQLIRNYKRENGLSATVFARRVGTSTTGVRAIIRDDRKRFSEDARDRLLKVLGLRLSDWFEPPPPK